MYLAVYLKQRCERSWCESLPGRPEGRPLITPQTYNSILVVVAVVVMLVVRTTVMVTPVIVVVIVVTMTLSDMHAARSNIHADVGRRSGLRRCGG
jgi:hypothetical protein